MEQEPRYIKFIVGGKEYSLNTDLFNIEEETPSFLPTLMKNQNNNNFQKQDVLRFDQRDPDVFEAIIRYYRTQMFIFPQHLPDEYVKQELAFWQLSLPDDKIKRDKINIELTENPTDQFVLKVTEFVTNLLEKYKEYNHGIIQPNTIFQFYKKNDKTDNYSISLEFLRNIKHHQKRIYEYSNYYINYVDNDYSHQDYCSTYFPLNQRTDIERLYRTVHMNVIIGDNETFEELQQKYEPSQKINTYYNCCIV